MEKKKLIFLDGDGTLWYPKATKRTKKPHWIYHDPATKDDFLAHMELAPGVREALEVLNKRGILLILISASPHSAEAADEELRMKLEHFGLMSFVHAYRSSSGDRPEGKGEMMLEIVRSFGFSCEDALMIGDSYFYDYLSAKNVGIEALFIENTVADMPDDLSEKPRSIREVSDLLDILG